MNRPRTIQILTLPALEYPLGQELPEPSYAVILVHALEGFRPVMSARDPEACIGCEVFVTSGRAFYTPMLPDALEEQMSRSGIMSRYA